MSASSNVAYNADTAPDGWCGTNSAACNNQSRLRTINTTSRASNPTVNTGNMYAYGNYYNWYSATAGNGKQETGSGVTVAGDICPAGWHLPYGGNQTSEKGNTSGGFYYLNQQMGAASGAAGSGVGVGAGAPDIAALTAPSSLVAIAASILALASGANPAEPIANMVLPGLYVLLLNTLPI